MKKRLGIYILFLSTGIILLLSGLFSKKPMLSDTLATMGIIILGFSAANIAPLLAQKQVYGDVSNIEWRDERNIVIREKADWYAGMTLIVVMCVIAFVLLLIDQLVGACIMAGLLLLYSLSIIIFSFYFSKKL